MKTSLAPLLACLFSHIAVQPLPAQYAPPRATQPFAGFANDWLRAQSPAATNWDFGALLRLRYEVKDNGGEIDFIVGCSLTKFASFEAGIGHFFTGGYVNSTFGAVGGSQDANWFYLQTTLSF
ncbi:MAG: hypothetical protein EXS27_06595 [Pedosphaera sp.]|nr:hypothetical protein [Pedosphaera sp.]